MKIWQFLVSIRQAWRRFVTEGEDVGPNLRQAAEDMLQILDRRSEAASLSMALADEAFDKLQDEIANHEGLGRQAEEFLREGDEEAAQRCVALQLQSAETIKRLKERYERLQHDAETNVSLFRNQRDEVEMRVTQLPELEEDERLLRAQETVAELSRLSLSNPRSAFDQAAQAVRVRQKQLLGKEMLMQDPNAELDQRIRAATDKRQLDQAMAALRQKVGQPASDSIDAEFTVVGDDDPVTSAKKLLEVPRFRALLPSTPAREPLRILRRGRG
ncbi:MAG: hypothetical protein KGZ30_01105 [Anaplasmataceae bacterium]|nr:hypothetical protein [Anaplasmataceae bacterium]